MENNNNSTSIKGSLKKLYQAIVHWLVAALFIYWGYSVLVSHFGLPKFSYIEIAGLCVGIKNVLRIFFSWSNKTIEIEN